MGQEGGADAVGTGGGVEAELWEERPDGAPMPGEDVGPSGDDGVAELEKDVNNDVFGKSVEAVLATAMAGGRPGRRGDLSVAMLRGWIWSVKFTFAPTLVWGWEWSKWTQTHTQTGTAG
jgi:hypothetical protein